jgi:prophage regulatory protein
MSLSTAAHSASDLPSPVFVRQTQVLAMVPISAPTLWRMVRSGRFPAPCKLGPNITAWRMSDVTDWCQGIRPNASN